MQVKNPRIGLLNIGEEECKGNDLSLKTFELLSNEKVLILEVIVKVEMYCRGFDVVVCDGFKVIYY